ncbi:MAG TPA: hypothetical protein VM578_03850 [Candidatus Saccharimonadales bacterium]|nr:hypothetical protein [Candidatus Saccharimonadales bacterium]
MKKLTQSLGLFVEIAVLLAAISGAMHADVGLMLNEALKVGASQWTGAGHSAVYLSGVCAASPVELRPCGPGENGAVLTNYRAFGEDRSYEWNAIPFNVYLYGVENESERPVYANPTVRWMLQERYRENYLSAFCAGSCATNPHALWRETVAATFLRDIYMFTVKTTPEQDRAVIEKFNRDGNLGHYNGLTYNCADFVRDVVNMYFPHAAKADRINDFWMTSPKAIARSFSHYAAKHPELDFHVVRFSQVPGEYAPSRDNRKGTEQLFRSNRWRLPLAVLRPHELVLFASSYIISGRFNPELELRRRPTGEVIGLEAELKEARVQGDREQQAQWKQKIRYARTSSLGTSEEWASYETAVQQYKAEAVELGYASNLATLRNITLQMVSTSWITMDRNGGLWLNARDGQSHPQVGLSAATLTEGRSDAKIGYLLALSRVDAELRKQNKNRETLVFFRKDWELMERLRARAMARTAPYLAGTGRTQSGGGAAQ